MHHCNLKAKLTRMVSGTNKFNSRIQQLSAIHRHNFATWAISTRRDEKKCSTEPHVLRNFDEHPFTAPSYILKLRSMSLCHLNRELLRNSFQKNEYFVFHPKSESCLLVTTLFKSATVLVSKENHHLGQDCSKHFRRSTGRAKSDQHHVS